MKEASMFRLDLFLAAAIFSIGSIVFLCIALFVVTLSKLFLTFVIAIGPLFVLCLAWRPTARFFDSWLSMVLNAVVLTWFAFFALGLSAFMGCPCSKPFRTAAASSAHLQRARRSHPLLRADDPDGDHVLPGAEPRIRADRRRRCSARHPDGPERDDGRRPAFSIGGAIRFTSCRRRRDTRW
jgi:hypothetical protein